MTCCHGDTEETFRAIWRRRFSVHSLYILCGSGESWHFFVCGGYEIGPSRTVGPVGWGMPPAGSSETANSFAVSPAGTFIIMWLIWPLLGLKTPALMGAPFMGTSQSW